MSVFYTPTFTHPDWVDNQDRVQAAAATESTSDFTESRRSSPLSSSSSGASTMPLPR